MPHGPLHPNPALRDVVYRNQWRDTFDGTTPPDWRPTLKVSVVTAAYNSATLPLTLASLAAQDYPADLLEVVVIDDGSEVPVEIGEFAPANTTLIRDEPGQGWGRSNALRIGIEQTDGDIIYWVDSDMILFSDNVREHAKWAHFIPEAATIGHKGFIEEWDFTPEQVFEEVRSDKIRSHHDLSTLHRHWSLDVFERTDDLNSNGGRSYSTHMGACATVTRRVYDRTNGQAPELRLGDDSEIAYQLWQRGAVFIPVQSAQTYHLGRATVQNRGDEVNYYNDFHFAQRMPVPRFRRSAENRQWAVPYITAVVSIEEESLPYVRECVDRLLNQTETDLHVVLVGPWSRLRDERRRVLDDPDMALWLLHEWFRSEGRVTMVEDVPDDVFPSPYRLDVPATVGLRPRAVAKMMGIVFGEDIGMVNFVPPDGDDTSPFVRVSHTAALSRAAFYTGDDVGLDEVVDALWGVEWRSNLDEFVDLRQSEPLKKVRRGEPERVAELQDTLRRTRKQLKVARERVRFLEGTERATVGQTVHEIARQGLGIARRARDRAKDARGPRHR